MAKPKKPTKKKFPKTSTKKAPSRMKKHGSSDKVRAGDQGGEFKYITEYKYHPTKYEMKRDADEITNSLCESCSTKSHPGSVESLGAKDHPVSLQNSSQTTGEATPVQDGMKYIDALVDFRHMKEVSDARAEGIAEGYSQGGVHGFIAGLSVMVVVDLLIFAAFACGWV